MTTDEQVFEAWRESILMAYTIAKAARHAEMVNRKRPKTFDEQGLHPYSFEWGRITAFEDLLPGLADVRFCGGRNCTPVVLRWEAQDDATREFAAEILRLQGQLPGR